MFFVDSQTGYVKTATYNYCCYELLVENGGHEMGLVQCLSLLPNEL